jgi:hypothetical protein
MNWPRLLAPFVILLGFVGCVPAADGPRHAPDTPYGQSEPRDVSGMH